MEGGASLGDLGHCLGALLHGCGQASPSTGENAKGVFHHQPCPREPIVKDPICMGQVPIGKLFHEPWVQGEGVIANEESCVIIREGLRGRKAKGALFRSSLKARLVENTGIRTPSLMPEATPHGGLVCPDSSH